MSVCCHEIPHVALVNNPWARDTFCTIEVMHLADYILALNFHFLVVLTTFLLNL